MEDLSMETTKKYDYKKLSAVVPVELYNAIKSMADKKRYSISDELRHILYKAVEQEEIGQ